MSTFGRDATPRLVSRYLVEHHNYSAVDADAAVKRQGDIVGTGVSLRSFANYVGDKVVEAEGHECDGNCKEEGEEEDDE